MAEATQRKFAVIGDNTFLIANKMASNQRLCRLLKYSVRDPFSKDLPDVDGYELINKQLIIVPKIWDSDNWKTSFVVSVFDAYTVNSFNPDFKTSIVRFDIACPYDEWVLDGTSLRPYLIMQEIDGMFNNSKMAGLGTLQFVRADTLTLSPLIGGYSMRYTIDEFN